MDEIDNKDDKNKKPKEYYQVNLDMGRIFWIVFLLGVVVIGIFVLGFFVGGGKHKGNLLTSGTKAKKDSGEVIVKKIFGEEGSKSQNTVSKSKVDIQDIFKQHPQGEMQVATSKSVQKALKNSKPVENLPQINIQKQYLRKPKSISVRKTRYKPVGDYYIQIASFRKKENALKLKKELEKSLYKVEIVKTSVNGVLYYRVRVGPFSSHTVAKNTMIAMKRRFNFKAPFIIKKRS